MVINMWMIFPIMKHVLPHYRARMAFENIRSVSTSLTASFF